MNYIAIGVLGFLVAYLFDVVSLKKIPWAKQCVGIIAVGLIGYSMLMVCLKSEKILLPIWSTWLGWAVLAASGFLLVYSLFINLPFNKTYVARGVGDKLVRSGTYALVRHPGVPLYALFLLSLTLVSRSKLLLLASPIWLSLDILWVVLQEKFFFNKMFEDYDSYKQETPMLFPNKKSLSACIRTLRKIGAQSMAPEGEKANVKNT